MGAKRFTTGHKASRMGHVNGSVEYLLSSNFKVTFTATPNWSSSKIKEEETAN